MNAKHTPGDWRATERGEIRRGSDVLAEVHDCASVNPRHARIMAENVGIDEAYANLHLMAAAPEMYEALRIARQFVVLAKIDGSEFAGTCLAQMDAALAKAERGK